MNNNILLYKISSILTSLEENKPIKAWLDLAELKKEIIESDLEEKLNE